VRETVELRRSLDLPHEKGAGCLVESEVGRNANVLVLQQAQDGGLAVAVERREEGRSLDHVPRRARRLQHDRLETKCRDIDEAIGAPSRLSPDSQDAAANGLGNPLPEVCGEWVVEAVHDHEHSQATEETQRSRARMSGTAKRSRPLSETHQ